MKPVVITSPLGDKPPKATLYYGDDVRQTLQRLPSKSVHVACTSPPYWGLRDYKNKPTIWGGDPNCNHQWDVFSRPGMSGGLTSDKVAIKGRANFQAFDAVEQGICKLCGAWKGQLGLEPTPELFVAHLVEIFQELHRVLRDDGIFWLNLGDSYANDTKWGGHTGGKHAQMLHGDPIGRMKKQSGVKPKELVGIPWMVAFALRNAGWWLRQDIIWAKVNAMPESVVDRCTKAHEYLFLLAKSANYYWNFDAIAEPCQTGQQQKEGSRNRRSVWTVPTQPYPGAHFATWPEKLVTIMLQAGLSDNGHCCSHCGQHWEKGIPACSCHEHTPSRCTVLDPFSGSATTGVVAMRLGADYIGVDLQSGYLKLAVSRLGTHSPGGQAMFTNKIREQLSVFEA